MVRLSAPVQGTLDNGNQVAVKRLSKTLRQGDQEFKNEAKVLGKLQHRNLVRLLGSREATIIGLVKTYKIIGGAARGILYLHEDSHLRIVHRDIKASNVLLDKDMNAKVSNFGLAKILGFEDSHGNTNQIAGTL